MELDPNVSAILNRARASGYYYHGRTLRKDVDNGRYYALEVTHGIVERVLYDKEDKILASKRVV